MSLKACAKLLVSGMAKVLEISGRNIAKGISKDYMQLARQLNVQTYAEKYWLATIMGGVWVVGAAMSKTTYLNYVSHIYRLTVRSLGNLQQLRRNVQTAVYAKGYPGTLKNILANMLIFHGEMLNNYGGQNIVQNPARYENLIIKDAMQTKGVGQFSATVPFLILALSKALPQNVNINDLEPPLGRNVIKGIKFLAGIKINPDNAEHRKISKEIHTHLANLAQTDIFTINCGLYELGK